MKCATCNHENRDGAKFCEECATPLKRMCASCGAELRPTAKFCDECAAPTGPKPPSVTQPNRPAEPAGARKVVTTVFADLIGSTALHERVDAESARRLMERYYDALRTAVEAHGGTVVKLLGDGVMAAFGVPQVAEDDALRAVRAGVAMQETFRGLVGEQAGVFGEVGLRVAVNTGEVVVSGGNDDVVGDPVNVAARLQQEAGDGDVVIGEATRRLVGSLVTLEPLGSFTLKGRAESVRAYRVVSLERPAGASATPFVGREGELARLASVYESAISTPAARLAVLLGSPGLGKSRLIEEFSRMQSESATVIFAHCDAAGGATFAPVAEALREFLHIGDAASGAALRVAVDAGTPGSEPDRGRIVDGITALLAGSPASPEETFFVVRRLLAALAGVRPVVLVIDDFQWAEPLLLDLVEHLVQWGSGVPLLVLVGARPELRDTRSSLVTPGGLVADVMTLAGLDAGAAMRLAASVIGAADLPAAVAAKVLATSEGNPLFVGELVRMMVQEGALERHGDRWTSGAGLAELEMPPTIHALLAARIERLRPDDRIVLERAAVVGRHFSRSAVAELLPRDFTDLDARLEALRRSELIERDTGWFLGEPVLRFHHMLIRDAAYRRVLKGTRAELHERFADWIEARAGESAEHDEIIGWHLEQAHQHLGELGPIDEKGRALGERAARYLATAGRRALARDDLPLAASLLGRAIDRLDASDPQRADLALDWCEALLAAGDVGPAAAAIDELGRFTADSDRLRAWHTCFAGQLTVFTAPQALHATTDAVATAAETLTRLGDAAGEAKAHFVHAQALARLGKVGACEAALDRALAAARRAGDRRRANAVLAGAPLAALWGPSPVTRASGRCLDVVRVLRITQGAPAVEAVALSCQGVLEALRGRTDAARRMIASSRKMVEELGITHRLLEADVFGGQIDLIEGDAVAAERSLRGAYEGLRELGLGIDAAQAAALLARALLAQGRAAEAETLSHESEALAGDDLKAAIAWRGVRAEALARRGEHVAAVELAEAAVAIASATDALLDHADARLALAAALRAAGRSAEADAQESRATELWEAKGATLLADRARHGVARVEVPTDANEARIEATGPARRRVRPNAATADAARVDAAVAARDPNALRELFAEDLQVDDHTTGIVFDRQGALSSFGYLITARNPTCRNEPMATLGETLSIYRFSVSASGLGRGKLDVGAYEKEEIHLNEVDAEGRRRWGEVFATDHLNEAIARLYERYAELQPEGPIRTRATVTAQALAAIVLSRGPEAWATSLTPDAEQIDHRQLATWNARGRDAIVANIRSLYEVAVDVTLRTRDVLALAPDAVLLRRMHAGIDRLGGGAYERPLLLMLAFATDGRVARVEFFDDDAEAVACARFDALTGRTEAELTPSVRRRVRMNAARMIWVRTDAAVAARDPDAFVPLYSEDYQEIDHPTGSTYGLDGSLASVKRLLRSRDARLYHEPLATLGESLDLSRRIVRASGTGEGRFDVGEYENEAISLVEVDERGLCVRQEVFATDHLADAIIRLYELRAEQLPEGRSKQRIAEISRTIAKMYHGLVDPNHLENPFAADVEMVDHRRVGLGTVHGAESVLDAVRAFVELVQNATWRTDDVLALTDNACVQRAKNAGTDRVSGGPFERAILSLCLYDDEGRVCRWETFEDGDEAEALARFDELTREPAMARPSRRRVRPNLATVATARFATVFAARDDAALEVLFGEALAVIDHPNGAAYGRTGHLESVRQLQRATNPKLEFESLATLGESLALSRRRITASGSRGIRFDVAEWQREEILLSEVDEHARIQRLEIFAGDRLRDAVARLYERHAELMPDGAARMRARATAQAAAAWLGALGDQSGERLESAIAPDIEFTEHGVVALPSLRGADEVKRAFLAVFEVGDDIDNRTDDILGLEANVWLLRATLSGTGRTSGGVFERPLLSLCVFGPDGRAVRYEVFDGDRVDAALARFEEIGASATTPEPCFANAASRAIDRLTRHFYARDWAGSEAGVDPAARVHDRRRMMHLESRAAEFLAGHRLLFDVPEARWEMSLLATRGERLSLHHVRFSGNVAEGGGPLEMDEHLCLAEVGADARVVTLVLFDLDNRDVAYAELDARYEAGDGAAYGGVPARYRAGIDAINRREWSAFSELYTPGFAQRDHRVLGWGDTLSDVETWVRAQQALVELSPDARYRVDHVRWSGRALFSQTVQVGTREGGAFETPMLLVGEWDEAGRVLRFDSYDVDRLDVARARFEEIGARNRTDPSAKIALPDRPSVGTATTNAADAALKRWQVLFAEASAKDDWGVFGRICAPGMVFEDRRRLALLTGGHELMVASLRERVAVGAGAERHLVGTAGDRVAMSRMLWSGGPAGGRFEIEYLSVNEVDEAGQFTAIILFDCDDRCAAQREAWARWAAIDPVAAPWVDLLTELTDAWNTHDRVRVLAMFADDFVVEDHRHSGLGRIEGADAYMRSLAVLWDLAPDQRIEFGWSWRAFDHHRALVTLRREGTLADGGAFENDYLWLGLAKGGRLTRLKLFEPEDLDAALARFEELSVIS